MYNWPVDLEIWNRAGCREVIKTVYVIKLAAANCNVNVFLMLQSSDGPFMVLDMYCKLISHVNFNIRCTRTRLRTSSGTSFLLISSMIALLIALVSAVLGF
jgi:hypothetical protein